MTPLGLQYIGIVLSRWRLVLGLVVGCTLGAWAYSVFVMANDPRFESSARLNIVPTSEELGYATRFVRGSTFDGGGVLLQTYAEFAHTRPIVAPIVDRYIDEQAAQAGLGREAWLAKAATPVGWSPRQVYSLLNYGAAPRQPLREQLIDALIKYTLIETVEGTYLIRVTVTWDDPRAAAWFANALSDAIIARADRMSRASGNQIAHSLTGRLEAKQAELASVIAQSRAMKKALGVVDIDRQKQALLEARVVEQSQLTSDRATLKANQGQVAGLRRESNGKLSSAQQVLEQTLAVEGPRGAGIQGGIAIRERRIAQLEAQLVGLGRNEDAVKTLDDRATALRAEVAALTERSSFSEVENLANAPRIQMIERAVPPLTRSSPKVLLNTALGFVAGCALAGCALLLLGPARPREADEDVEEARRDEPADAAGDVPEPATATATATATENVLPIRPQETTPSGPYWSIGGGPAATAHAVAPEFETEAAAMPEPVPAAVGRIEPDDHLFANVLPRPADGRAYDAEEQAAFAPPVMAWLAAPLADARPLLIVGMDRDRDAQDLYRLIYHDLRARGVAVRTYDATTAWPDAIDRDSGAKALIYAGGLGESGSRATLVRADDSHIVVATGIPAGSSAIGRTRACGREIERLVSRRAYVVALGA